MEKILTFEFPTAERAREFFEFTDGLGIALMHRVVDTTCGDEREVAFAREAARMLCGVEVKS
jgi:hypothetical protein